MSFITYRKVRMMSDQEKVLFILSGAPSDPPVSDPEFQRELRAFSAALREAGIVYSQRAMAFGKRTANTDCAINGLIRRC